MTHAAPELAQDSHASNAIGPGTASTRAITTIAAELADLEARLEPYRNVVKMSEAQLEAWNHLYSRLCELEDILVRARPRNAREAVVTAAVAFGKARDTDEVGGVLHTEACKMLARVLGWIEADAGVTAAELGLGHYTGGSEAPVHSGDGADTLRAGYEAGYLAAVARFAPSFYPYVRRELESGRTADGAPEITKN
jgi:hypothetical protein